MLKKAADKAVMNGFGRGMLCEGLEKFLVFHKEIPEQLRQVRIFYTARITQKLLVHHFGISLTDRKVIRRDILTGIRFPDLLQGRLEGAIKIADRSGNIDVIQDVKLTDTFRIRVPYLGIDLPGAILKYDCFIIFPVFCDRKNKKTKNYLNMF